MDGTTLTLVDELDDVVDPVSPTTTRSAAPDATDLPWWVLLVAAVFLGLGFAAPGLWALGVVTLAVWAAGFLLRREPGATWYGW